MPHWLDKYVSPKKKKVSKKGETNSGGKRSAIRNARGSKASSSTDVAMSESRDAWECLVCEKLFTGEDDKILECEGGCEKHFCIKCIEMTDIQYNTLQRLDCFWYCPTCVNSAKQLGINQRQRDTLAEVSIKKLVDELTEKFKALERKIEMQISTCTKDVPEQINRTWAEVVKNKTNEVGGDKVEEMKKIVKDSIYEQKMDEISKERREENIIIYRVPESNEAEASGRKSHDTSFFNSLCTDALEIPIIGIKNITRLGEKSSGFHPTARPIKISLRNKDDRQIIMKNLRKLKDAEEKYKTISVGYDLTLDERKKQKEKVLEAKKKEEEESEGGRWIFRVRGPPWRLKIVRIKSRALDA